MTAITFDTLKYAERLKRGGFSEEQAKTEAEALADVFASGAGGVASKADLSELKRDMDVRFERVEGELKLLKWMLAAVFAAVVIPLIEKLL